jgi:hypothetical protein
LYRGISDFKKGYQPRNNIVKDEKGDLIIDPHSVLARWRELFSQLLNVQGPEPRAFEIEMAMEELKEANHQGLIKSQQH